LANVFVFGHGEWKPSDGYTVVPAGTSVKFFTEGNKLMSVAFATQLMTGQAPAARPDMEAGAFRSVQNMRLYPAPEFHSDVQQAVQQAGGAAGDIRIVSDAGGVTLQALLEDLKGNDITWIACRALGLKEVNTKIGGAAQRIGGMNVIQR
jgi:putative adhesin Stv-like protein